MDLAVQLFSLVGFILQDGMFDLESTSRRRAQMRDALQHNVALSERLRAGRARRHRPYPASLDTDR